MISLGLWLAEMFGKSVTEKQAKRFGMIVGVPLIVLALVLLAFVGVKLHDRGVIAVHEDKQDAAIANATVAADREATTNANARANVAEAENARLENAMQAAEVREPAKAKAEVGPVQQSYFSKKLQGYG